jgi:hypothetical protein
MLEQVKANRFKLLEAIHYVRPDASSAFEVTPDILGETDLTSVPFGFRWFVNAYGRHTLPALLHDCLIDPEDAAAATLPGGAPPPDRSEADDIFLEALRDRRVPLIRRRLMWSSVTFNTRFSYAGLWARLFTILWILCATAGTLTFFSAWWWAGPWLSILATFAPIPAAALWGAKWRAGIWFGYGVVFLVPAAIVVHASYFVYAAVERVIPQGPVPAEPPSPKTF